VKIYVIDNGGQWTHREWRVLRDLDVECEIKSNESALSELRDADGIVLSGGAPSIAYESFKLGNTAEFTASSISYSPTSFPEIILLPFR